ncbi:MAG: DUF4405 domain-containing protein [Desulfobulbus sp.]|nr:DUF4405 domain-containing protein [Desulfobulbus sp.]
MNENTTSKQTLSRKWVTPFTLGAFLLSAVTGILLFFKVHSGLIKPTHEWLSWLLVIAAVLHIVLNYRPLLKTLTQPLGKTLMVIFVLLIGVSFLPLGDQGEHGGEHDDHAPSRGKQHHREEH